MSFPTVMPGVVEFHTLKRHMAIEPSRATIKKLFALSSNRCAYRNCTVPMVDGVRVMGEICHIAAANPSGARFDERMTDLERAAFENLVLMCPTHHTVIDSDAETYTVERLATIKRSHEERAISLSELSDKKASELIQTVHLKAEERPLFIGNDNRGGQMAHQITNIFHAPTNEAHTTKLHAILLDCVFGTRPAHITSPHFSAGGFARLQLWSETPTSISDMEVLMSDPYQPQVTHLVGPSEVRFAEPEWPTGLLGEPDRFLEASESSRLAVQDKSKPVEGWFAFSAPPTSQLGERLHWNPLYCKVVVRLREFGGYTGWRLSVRFREAIVLEDDEATPFERRLWQPVRLVPREDQRVEIDNDW